MLNTSVQTESLRKSPSASDSVATTSGDEDLDLGHPSVFALHKQPTRSASRSSPARSPHWPPCLPKRPRQAADSRAATRCAGVSVRHRAGQAHIRWRKNCVRNPEARGQWTSHQRSHDRCHQSPNSDWRNDGGAPTAAGRRFRQAGPRSSGLRANAGRCESAHVPTERSRTYRLATYRIAA